MFLDFGFLCRLPKFEAAGHNNIVNMLDKRRVLKLNWLILVFYAVGLKPIYIVCKKQDQELSKCIFSLNYKKINFHFFFQREKIEFSMFFGYLKHFFLWNFGFCCDCFWVSLWFFWIYLTHHPIIAPLRGSHGLSARKLSRPKGPKAGRRAAT